MGVRAYVRVCLLVAIASVHYVLLLVSHCLFVVAAFMIAVVAIVAVSCGNGGGVAAAVASLLVI